MENKCCTRCGETKPVSDFFKTGKQKSGKIKLRGDCKVCASKDTANWRNKNRSEYNNYVAMWRAKNPDKQHATEIKRNYGLSKDQYNSMLIEQNYKCAICGKKHDLFEKRGKLYVDHCHATNKIRGLLCGGCNSALGHMNDDIALLEKAIKYLNQ